MALLVFLALLAAPVVEIYVIIQVGGAIGALPTLALLLATAALGVLVIRGQGVDLVRRAQVQVRAGEDPTPEMLDRLLIIAAGVLLILPGFLSDVIAVLLLVPPLRHMLGHDLGRRIARRVSAAVRVATSPGATAPGQVYDARVVEDLGDVTPPEWRPGVAREPGSRPPGDQGPGELAP